MVGNPARYLVYSRYNELLWIDGEIFTGSSNHSRDILHWIFQNCISKYLQLHI